MTATTRAFDFVVNSLDEALRTLKNEIRQRRPLAVALLADPDQVTDEAAERGLAPRLILSGLPREETSWFYLLRLAGFGLIIFAVVAKNARSLRRT